MSQNFLKSPKAKILAIAPKAKCIRDWTGGDYKIDFGQSVTDINGKSVTEMSTGTLNPADAWFYAVVMLRLV